MIHYNHSEKGDNRGLKGKKKGTVHPQKQNDKSRWWALYKKLGGKGNYKTITTQQMIDYIALENQKKASIVKASKQAGNKMAKSPMRMAKEFQKAIKNKDLNKITELGQYMVEGGFITKKE